MYGGQRLKKTRFLMNFIADNLKRECDGRHQHLPWGKTLSKETGQQVFSTSTEAEYPWQLCKQLAFAFFQQMRRQGKVFEQNSPSMDVNQRMGAGTQPRGKLAPLLLSEFKFKVVLKSTAVEVPKVITDSAPPPFQGVPMHSKCISTRTEVIEEGSKGEEEIQISEFGVYRSPEEFLRLAATLQHPLDSPQLVESSNLRAILAIRDWPAADVVAFRAKALKHYMQVAVDLMVEEKSLRQSMDPQVNEVLAGKRLCLFKQMCNDAGVGDQTLFKELTEGFRLTGRMCESGQFPRKLRPAAITVKQLRDSAVWAKRMIYASCKPLASDPEIAEAVYQETMQQLHDGWVQGPFSMQQMDERHNGCWIPSKRFGVRQGGKVRAVDDFSEFLINSSVTTTEKLALYGIDEVVNTARVFMGADLIEFDGGGFPKVAIGAGPTVGSWRPLHGRALDLKAAYKQLARHPEDSWASVLAVWCPEKGDVEFFDSVALPFGSVSAVMSFNRMARALRIIMAQLFLLVNTNFFDDFCQLETLPLCQNAWETAEMIMKLLGWKISTSEEKRLPFAACFQMLGAVVDLSEMSHGRIMVRNKPARLDDIAQLVNAILSKPKVPQSLIETLRGRLLYAAGHTFGKCTQLAVQLIAKATRSGPLVLLDERTKQVIRSALEMLQKSGPRVVAGWSGTKPILIFTDGACEQEGIKVTHGAVFADFFEDRFLYFGDDIPQCWTSKWRASGKTQLICQAEFFPVLVSKLTWIKEISGRAALWFVDNSSAQSALIRSFSPVFDNYELLVINAELDVLTQSMNWYARVPSPSNPGDAPSRLEFQALDTAGYTRCKPCYSLHEIDKMGVERREGKAPNANG